MKQTLNDHLMRLRKMFNRLKKFIIHREHQSFDQKQKKIEMK